MRGADAYAARMAAETGRPWTIAEAEADIVESCYKIARILAPSFTLPSYTRADVVQFAVLAGLEAIEDGSYDPSRPITAFMRVHMRRRLLNEVRRTLRRTETPCTCCDDDTIDPCPRRAWLTSTNAAKAGLAKAADVTRVPEDRLGVESRVVDAAVYSETRDRIDAAMPAELRRDYARLLAGEELPPYRAEAVRDVVRRVIGEPQAPRIRRIVGGIGLNWPSRPHKAA